MRHLWSMRLSRFAAIGLAATLLYALAALTFGHLGLPATAASVAAYLLAAIFSYAGHKYVTFVSEGRHAFELPRFLAVTASGLAVASILPAWLTGGLGLPPAVPVLLACLVIPAVNYVLLGTWVFGEGKPKAAGVTGLGHGAVLLPAPWAAASVALIGVAAYALNEVRWGTIPDTSWMITLAERIASGDRLYIDLAELNPPFSVWLYMIPERIAAALGVSPESAVRVYVLLICLAGSSLTGWMLNAAGMLTRGRATAVSVALFAIETLLSGNAFSERDQIGAVLGMPLLMLAAWRMLPEPRSQPRTVHWLVAGLGGGVLAMVKPHFAIAIIAVACLLAIRRRDIRMFFQPEFLLSGFLTAAYLAASYKIYPAYFEEFLPLLRETYLQHRLPIDWLLIISLPWLILPIVYGFLRGRNQNSEPSDLLMLASIAALAPFFLQGKGWPYHSYPAVLFGSAALVVNLAVSEKRRVHHALVRAAIILVAVLIAHLRFASTQKPSDDMVAAALQAGETPTVAMLGGAINAGHPLSRMINGRWIEPYCSDWLPTYAGWRQDALAIEGDQAGVDRLTEMIAGYMAVKRERLLRQPPQILIVSRKDRLVPRMLGEFGFQPILDRYEKIAASESVELYRLQPN